MIPLPRIRFVDQNVDPSFQQAYVLLTDPSKFCFDSFHEWCRVQKYYVNGIIVNKCYCRYTIYSDLPTSGTLDMFVDDSKSIRQLC